MASHNKYTVGYCNPYRNVALLSMRICKIDGWQEINDYFTVSGEKERTLYLPDNQPQWKDTTIYYSLDIVIHVGMWAQNKYMR